MIKKRERDNESEEEKLRELTAAFFCGVNESSF